MGQRVHWKTPPHRSVPSSMTPWYDITRSRLLAPRLCITSSREALRRRDFSPQIRATDIFRLPNWKDSSSLFLLQRGAERRWEAAARTSLREGVELVVGGVSVVAPPALPPPSARTRTHARARRYAFPIFPSTAYHVIVETYAGERAAMCSGPGVRREAEGYTVRCR